MAENQVPTEPQVTEDDGKAAANNQGSVSAELLESLKAKLDNQSAELEKAKAQQAETEAKQKAEERKKKAADKVEQGQAKEAIESLNSQLETVTAELNKFRKAQEARVDAMVDALPEEKQEQVRTFKAAMDLTAYEELVRLMGEDSNASGTTAPAQGATPPPPASTAGPASVRDRTRQLQPETIELLDQFMVDASAGEKLQVKDGRFGLPLKEFIKGLQKRAGKGQLMNKESAHRVLDS